MDSFASSASACDVTALTAFLCGWVIDNVVCEPYDFDNGACREQYELGSDDSGTPPPGSDLVDKSEDNERVTSGGSCDNDDDNNNDDDADKESTSSSVSAAAITTGPDEYRLSDILASICGWQTKPKPKPH